MIDNRFESREQNGRPPPGAEAEFDWLMSLALDDLLDANDRARFDALLADFPPLAESWGEWRALDRRLEAAPHVMPAPGFVARFEARLAADALREQQRVWALMAGAVVVALAVGALVTIGLGNFVLTSYGAWFGIQLHNLTFAAATLAQWTQSLQATLEAVVNTPQARTLGFIYAGLACVVAVFGVQLMRRTAHLNGTASIMIGLE